MATEDCQIPSWMAVMKVFTTLAGLTMVRSARTAQIELNEQTEFLNNII